MEFRGKKVLTNKNRPTVYWPEHPCSHSDGCVYIHRIIAYEEWGNAIDNMNIHHKDEDIYNWDISNLEIMSPEEHASLHAPEIIKKSCPQCSKIFRPSKNRIKFCSKKCADKIQRKFEVSKEELEKLIWQMPTIKVAELFNVSDKAIEKRCKKFGVKKPPRGYWAKQYAGVAQ